MASYRSKSVEMQRWLETALSGGHDVRYFTPAGGSLMGGVSFKSLRITPERVREWNQAGHPFFKVSETGDLELITGVKRDGSPTYKPVTHPYATKMAYFETGDGGSWEVSQGEPSKKASAQSVALKPGKTLAAKDSTEIPAKGRGRRSTGSDNRRKGVGTKGVNVKIG